MKTNLLKTFFAALLLLCSTVVSAHDFEVDGVFYNITDATAKTVEVTYKGDSYRSNGYSGSVVIPSSLSYNGETYSVTTIRSNAFYECTNLTSIEIPASVTKIGSDVFHGCTGLTAVHITDLSAWCNIDFAYERYTEDHSNPLLVAHNLYLNGDKITNLVIPDGVTTIKRNAFNGCRSLVSVTIPNSVTTIAAKAFQSCTGLTSVTIPNSVTQIGYNAFQSCSKLTDVHITDVAAWCNINHYYDVNHENHFNPFSYPYNLYLNGEKVNNLVIPEGVLNIKDYTFYNCTGLTSVTIPSSVTKIGSAFRGCTNIKFVYNNSSLNITAGSSAHGYVAYNANVVIIPTDDIQGDFVFRTTDGAHTLIAYTGNDATEIALPNDYNGENYAIGSYAFQERTEIVCITIPNSVTSIGSSAFYECTALKFVYNNSSLDITAGSSEHGYVAFYARGVMNNNNSADYSIIDNCVFTTIDGEYTLVAYIGNDSIISLPDSYNDGNYTIGVKAFFNSKSLTEVTIPDGVTTIKDNAFDGCTNLTSVTIPGSVTTIGDGAFSGCSGLTSVTIPESVTSIGYGAFAYCSGLTSVTIPNSVTSIGKQAFYGCRGLTSVTIPNSVTSIEYGAFDGCTNLTSVTIPNSVTSIGGSAFYNCSGLTSVTIPESVTSIGEYAFEHCDSLKGVHINGLSAWCKIDFDGYNSNPLNYAHNLYLNGEKVTNLVIPGDVTEIKARAFSSCKGLTSVVIGNSVTSIGDYAFSGCSGLTSVTIPDGVTSIGGSAFSGCSGLTSVTIPNSVTSIGSYAFAYCSGLTSVTIPNSVTRISNYAFYECSNLASIKIPNSVTSIGDYAFAYCSGLTSIAIGKSVTSIGKLAFTSCSGLKTVYNFSSLKLVEGSVDNGYVAYSADNIFDAPNGSIEGDYVFAVINGVNTLRYYIGSDSIISLPEDYNGSNYEIAAYAFNRHALASVAIPNSVTSIGSYAFAYCSGLTSVTIGNSVTSIGDYAFSDCTGLKSATIGNSVTSIGDCAFYNCTGLKSIEIPNNVTSIGDAAFRYCSSLTSVEIGNSVTGIGNNAFNSCSGLKVVYNNSSLDVIAGASAHGYVAYYAAVVITENNRADYDVVGDYVFATTDSLPKLVAYIGNDSIISLPEDYNGSNYEIGAKAFYNCDGLISIEIPTSVTTIGYYAFNGCSDLKVVYNNSLLDIIAGASTHGYVAYYAGAVITENNRADYDFLGDYIFATTDSLPKLVAYIGNDSIISLPEDYNGSNYEIGAKAFYNCDGLISIEIPTSVTTIGDNAFYDCDGLTSIEIPNNVTSIGDAAFKYCSSLVSVTIPNSVTSIGEDAFNYCTGLKEVNINDLSAWCKIDFANSTSNPLYYAKKLSLNGEKVTNLVIPGDVTEIKYRAFYSCSSLTSVTIPNSVTSIGDYAFYNCTGLTEIYVKATTPPTIASNTFYNCYSATLYVPAGSKAAYQAADYWKRFTNIEEIIIPGDINGDINVDVADVTMLVSAILNGEGAEETPTEQTFEDWTSTNAGVDNSTSQNSYTLEAAEGSVLTFDWSVSSESNYDWLTITLDGTQILRKSGSYSGSYEHTFTAAGTHTLVAKYTKDGSANSGSDQGEIYNIKLSGSTSSKDNSTADINGDGTVDVADVTRLISFILGTDTANAAPAKAAATRAGEISTVSADGDGETLLININNPGYPFSAIQFDIELPEGIEVDFDGEYYAVDLGSRTNSRKHSYPECAIQPDGSLRVVIISMSNALYNGTEGDVATATLKVNGADDGDYRFTIKNVVLSAPGSKEKLAPYTGWITVTNGVTGIDEITADGAAADGAIYDLQGRKVTEPVKGGIYIQNGKKVMW